MKKFSASALNSITYYYSELSIWIKLDWIDEKYGHPSLVLSRVSWSSLFLYWLRKTRHSTARAARRHRHATLGQVASASAHPPAAAMPALLSSTHRSLSFLTVTNWMLVSVQNLSRICGFASPRPRSVPRCLRLTAIGPKSSPERPPIQPEPTRTQNLLFCVFN